MSLTLNHFKNIFFEEEYKDEYSQTISITVIKNT